jgi:PAS domain S-box-containing protein
MNTNDERIGAIEDPIQRHLDAARVTVEKTLRRKQVREREKELARQLRESEEGFRLLVESVKDYAIFMLDPNGIITSWNEGARRIKGYEAEEIIGSHFSCFYPKEAAESGWPARALEIAGAEGKYEEQGWRIRKDGSSFWADVLITALRDPSGNLTGFAKITRDLTEQKRIQDQIRNLNRDLEARVNERTAKLRAALVSLEAEFAERMRLEHEILEISEWERARVGQDLHDGLCQTLTGIGLTAKVLQQNLEKNKLRPSAAAAETKKIVELVKEATGEAHDLAFGMYPVDIEEQGLAYVLEKLAACLTQHFRIRCIFKCAEPVHLADSRVATHLYRIAQEAAGNACKHGLAEVVLIKLAATRDGIILEIDDNGNGTLEELKPTGMGLKTMNYRARAIGGSLLIRQRRKHGLAVTCSIPDHQNPEALNQPA